MANFLFTRKFSSSNPAVWALDENYSKRTRKFSSSNPAVWALDENYSFRTRKFASFQQGVNFTINEPPIVANPIPDQQNLEDEIWDFIFAEDTFEDPEMQPLTYTATKGDDSPLPAWITFTGATRRFVGTPTNDDVGFLDIKVIAEDDVGSTVSDTFQLEIINVNDGPTVDQGISDQIATADTAFNFQFPSDAFEDIDGDTLTYTAELENGDPLPNWLMFDSSTRTFSGVPATDDIGSLNIKVIAEDGN